MQVAIVTGATGGIGFGCATKLAEAGMAVLATGRNGQRLDEVAAAIGDPDRVETVAVDLTDDDGPARVVEAAVDRWGRIDFLINNAGVGNPTPLHGTDDETLDYFLNVMLRAPFRLARDVLPHMEAGSAIINITSTFAVVGGLRGGPYSAAKGGLTADALPALLHRPRMTGNPRFSAAPARGASHGPSSPGLTRRSRSAPEMAGQARP